MQTGDGAELIRTLATGSAHEKLAALSQATDLDSQPLLLRAVIRSLDDEDSAVIVRATNVLVSTGGHDGLKEVLRSSYLLEIEASEWIVGELAEIAHLDAGVPQQIRDAAERSTSVVLRAAAQDVLALM